MSKEIKEAYNSLYASASLKEATKKQLEMQMTKKEAPKSTVWKYALSFSLLLALFLGSFQKIYATPVAYLSLDINPSIELSINRFNKVIKVAAYNDDGQAILSLLSIKGLSVDDALNELINDNKLQQYFVDTNELVFTLAASNNNLELVLNEKISNCMQNINIKCSAYHSNMECVNEAHEAGISLGKYQAYLLLKEVDDSYTLEDIKEMKMSEIHQCINECGKNNSNGNMHHGNGKHHGK